MGTGAGDVDSDDKPAAYCQRRVGECQVHAGLIGLRYGSPVRDRPEVSYTEPEFEAATDAGLVRLVFLLDADAALPIPASALLDADPELRARQRAFRDRLATEAGVIVARVASPEDLQLQLLHALQESRAGAGGPGGGVPSPGEVAALGGRRYGCASRRPGSRGLAARYVTPVPEPFESGHKSIRASPAGEGLHICQDRRSKKG